MKSRVRFLTLSAFLLTSVVTEAQSGAGFIKAAELPTLKAQAQKRGEVFASQKPVSNLSEERLSKEFRALRDSFLSMRTADDVESFLKKTESNYEKLPPDAKFFAALLGPLTELRSAFFRIVPLLKPFWGVRNATVASVQGLIGLVKSYTDAPHVDAILNYLVEPASLSVPQFTVEEDYRKFVVTKVYPAFALAARRIAALDFSAAPILGDYRLFYGANSFADGQGQFFEIRETERNLVLAWMQQHLAILSVAMSYNMSGAVQFADDFGRLWGVNGFRAGAAASGVSMSEIVQVVRSPKFVRMGLLSDDGKAHMAVGFQHLRESVYRTLLFWEEQKARPMGAANDSGIMGIFPYRGDVDAKLKELEALMGGRAKLRSPVTGEVVTVNVSAFFLNPPQDLKMMLPNKFEAGAPYLGKGLLQWKNYRRGRSLGWRPEVYAGIFPDAAVAEDVAKAARVLRHSAGAGTLMLPFMIFLH
jgi:hypothetical protein